MKRLNKALILLVKNQLLEDTFENITTILENIEPFSAIIRAKNDEIDWLNKHNQKQEKKIEDLTTELDKFRKKAEELLIDKVQLHGRIINLKEELYVERKMNITKALQTYKITKRLNKQIRKLKKKESKLNKRIARLFEKANYKLLLAKHIKLEKKLSSLSQFETWLKQEKLPTSLAGFKLMMESANKNAIKAQQLEQRMKQATCANCGSDDIKFGGKHPLIYRAMGELAPGELGSKPNIPAIDLGKILEKGEEKKKRE